MTPYFISNAQGGQDLFSSMHEMDELNDLETEVVEKLEEHLKHLEAQIHLTESYLDTYYKDYNQTEEDAMEYISHPINTFSLIKRQSDWLNVKGNIFSEQTGKDLEEISSLLNKIEVSADDLEGAVHGIFLLTHTYKLNISELAEGKIRIPEGQVIDQELPINSFILDEPISAQDLLLLGKLAYNQKHFDKSIEFLEVAAEKAEKENIMPIAKEAKSILKLVTKNHDEVFLRPVSDPRFRVFAKPFDKDLANKKKFAKIKSRIPKFDLGEANNNMKKAKDKETYTRHLEDIFSATCRGVHRHLKYDSHLFCKHIHYQDPYLKLGPFKFEEKNSKPFVGIFHDFMSDTEIDAYINYANNKLERSMHSKKVLLSTEQYGASFQRTSKQAWFPEFNHEHDQLKSDGELINEAPYQVSLRIRKATMMNTFELAGGESYQVANYGLGGQYHIHLDAGPDGRNMMTKNHGDRIQTFMVYLSNVEAGGATVFPLLGLGIWPKKGDAITWYNIHKNGKTDQGTYHGGCPVIKGMNLCLKY